MKMECPNCGGNIIYILGSEYVYCEYCNKKINVSDVPITEFSKYAEKIHEEVKQKSILEDYKRKLFATDENWQSPILNQEILSCKRCKSEFINYGQSVTNNCPFCFSDSLKKVEDEKPYYVSRYIPFRLGKNTIAQIINRCINFEKYSSDDIIFTYVPFRASYNDIKAKGRVNIIGKHFFLKEKLITLNYIGKSIKKKLAESCLDYDFSMCIKYNINLANDGVILDNIDSSASIKDRRKIIESINHDLQIKEKFKIIKNKNINLETTSIKEEIWLLPMIIIKEHRIGLVKTLIINGQTGRLVGRAVNHGKKKLEKDMFWISAVTVLLLLLLMDNHYYFNFKIFLIITSIITLIIVYFNVFKKAMKVGNEKFKFYGITYEKELTIK